MHLRIESTKGPQDLDGTEISIGVEYDMLQLRIEPMANETIDDEPIIRELTRIEAMALSTILNYYANELDDRPRRR